MENKSQEWRVIPTQIQNKFYSLRVEKNTMYRITYNIVSELIQVKRERNPGENLSPSKMGSQFAMVFSGTSLVPQVGR